MKNASKEVSRVAKRAKDAQQAAYFYGHDMKPIPIGEEHPKPNRESTYVEEGFSEFLQQYANRMGASRAHALRRLAILGALSEGYKFTEELAVVK